MLCCHQAVQEQNLLTKTHKCPSWVTSMLATHTPVCVCGQLGHQSVVLCLRCGRAALLPRGSFHVGTFSYFM